MKKFIILSFLVLVIAACGGSGDQQSAGTTENDSATESTTSANPDYDPERGEGKFKEVKVDPKLNEEMASKGEKIVDLKCGSCHKMTDEKLVGPGWKGVTTRHKTEWIMKFMTNTDAMIDKDPKAQAMLEICMVRMPNQNLSDEDARSIYEYMRKNDGVK
jgi:cytochrome c2